MSEQNTKIDGRTKRALDMAIAERQVSQGPCRAVHAGEITLQQAKAMDRDGAPAADTGRASDGQDDTRTAPRSSSAEDGQDDAHSPPQAISRISKGDRTRSCMCGSGRRTGGRFAIGHDQRLLKFAYEHLKGDRELTEEQLAYLGDETNKLERAKARIERESRKKRQKADN